MKLATSFSIFQGNFFGHGGEKRTRQLEELLRKNFNYALIQLRVKHNSTDKISWNKKIRSLSFVPVVRSILKQHDIDLAPGALLDEAHKILKQNAFLSTREQQFGPSDLVIWENTFPDFLYLPNVMRQKYGKRVIACPHNLEALIPLQKQNWYGKEKFTFLKQELRALRDCDEVFTISEEEQWLLNVFDVKARYLPYYPLGELFDSLMAVRGYRTEHKSEPFFLVVGSVNNPPTRTGMVRLLEQLRSINLIPGSRVSVKVTGYGTESLANDFGSVNVEILGATDGETLGRLMKTCKGMIVSQGYSTGVLTKIPEMLVAGIPVIADNGGSRSYRRLEGLFVYDSQEELSELLTSNFSIPPVPARPDKYFDAFMSVC